MTKSRKSVLSAIKAPTPLKPDERRILLAAANRFLSQGLYKVTLDEVATDLGMSKKTVYKFFPSKEELLKSVVKIMMGGIERRVDEIVRSQKPFEEKLLSLFLMLVGFFGRFSRQFQLDVQRFAPNLWKEVEAFRRDHVLPKLRAMFQQAREEGVFRPEVDSDLFYLIFITTVQSIMTPQVLSQHSFSAEEAFRGIFRILFSGVLTKDAKARYDKLEKAISVHQPLDLL
ncbi:MAG: TetR/AcrR family transcriptional regulator [Ignavibacteriales bacterium]|nr:TetR/AcrR family transcriptional regulator [Ignavibacteriales bacterium]